MILSIIIGSAAAFGLFWTIKTKKIFPGIITLGMIIGIVLVLIPTTIVKMPGFYIYMAFVALAMLYGVIVKERKIGERIVITLLSASIFMYWLWVINHWHGNAVLFAILAFMVGLVAIFRKMNFKTELGFLLILFADSIAIIIENWMIAN